MKSTHKAIVHIVELNCILYFYESSFIYKKNDKYIQMHHLNVEISLPVVVQSICTTVVLLQQDSVRQQCFSHFDQMQIQI